MSDNFLIYKNARESGKIIIGVDEVGRGAWAGPLVVAGVILQVAIEGLRDSKKLNEARRIDLTHKIKHISRFVILSFEPDEISRFGLHQSNLELMRRVAQSLGNDDTFAFFDGYLPEQKPNYFAIKGGDDLIPEISAASIIAKTYRDNLMREYAIKYPQYDFDHNVGYGTPKHIDGLKNHGICDIHRTSFAPIKSMIKRSLP